MLLVKLLHIIHEIFDSVLINFATVSHDFRVELPTSNADILGVPISTSRSVIICSETCPLVRILSTVRRLSPRIITFVHVKYTCARYPDSFRSSSGINLAGSCSLIAPDYFLYRNLRLLMPEVVSFVTCWALRNHIFSWRRFPKFYCSCEGNDTGPSY